VDDRGLSSSIERTGYIGCTLDEPGSARRHDPDSFSRKEQESCFRILSYGGIRNMKTNKLRLILPVLLLAAMVIVPAATAYRSDNWGPNYGWPEDFSTDAYNAAVSQSGMGYGAYYSSNVPASSAWGNLPSDQVFSFNGHGNNGGIVFYDSSWLYANNPGATNSISKLTSGQINDLALAVFVNCESAFGSSNLLTATVGNGGDAAIGFSGDITKAQADYWTTRLWTRLNSYQTVQDAAIGAQADTRSVYWPLTGGTETMTYQGTTTGLSRTLKPAVPGS